MRETGVCVPMTAQSVRAPGKESRTWLKHLIQ